jgi:HTH-type transcriptional regulator, cell division transcriptional repressor
MQIHTLLGERISNARQSKNYSQQQLAELIGVKKSTIEKWELDKTPPRANRLNQLAGVLGVPVIWLMGGSQTPPDIDHPSLNETMLIESKLETAEALIEQLSEVIRGIRKQSQTIQGKFDEDMEINSTL